LDVAHGEIVEAELTRMIERRDEKRRAEEGDRLDEELYMDSVRRFHARSEAEMRSRWLDFHQNMHRLHSNLAEEHREKAEKLLEDEPGAA
jgi:hypothetical protein